MVCETNWNKGKASHFIDFFFLFLFFVFKLAMKLEFSENIMGNLDIHAGLRQHKDDPN